MSVGFFAFHMSVWKRELYGLPDVAMCVEYGRGCSEEDPSICMDHSHLFYVVDYDVSSHHADVM